VLTVRGYCPHGWGNQRKGDTSCAFTNGAYHIRISANDFFYDCLASSNDFSHFVFQVQVTIIKGFDAGIMFRSFNPQPIYYFFLFSYNGLYEFGSSGDLQGGGSVLAFGRSSAIKIGLNQPNLFSIMARNSNIDLFINKQLVKSWQAETQGGGAIGLIADNTMHALTDTAFSNAQVWKLP